MPYPAQLQAENDFFNQLHTSCIFRAPLCTKLFSQCAHLCSFSVVWVEIWCSMCSFRLNSLPQSWHGNRAAFGSCSRLKCVSTLYLARNDFPHPGKVHGCRIRDVLWTAAWFRKSDGSTNFRWQVWQECLRLLWTKLIWQMRVKLFFNAFPQICK